MVSSKETRRCDPPQGPGVSLVPWPLSIAALCASLPGLRLPVTGLCLQLSGLCPLLALTVQLMVVSNATRAEGSGEEGPAQIWSRAAQWLLFAQCQYYAFADSNFCKSSFGFNIGAPLMFQYPPLGEPMKAACEASHGHSLLSLVEWHGL